MFFAIVWGLRIPPFGFWGSHKTIMLFERKNNFFLPSLDRHSMGSDRKHTRTYPIFLVTDLRHRITGSSEPARTVAGMIDRASSYGTGLN